MLNNITKMTYCFVITPLSGGFVYLVFHDVYNVYISKQLSYPRPFSYKLLVNPGMAIGFATGLLGYNIGIPIVNNLHKLKWN